MQLNYEIRRHCFHFGEMIKILCIINSVYKYNLIPEFNDRTFIDLTFSIYYTMSL